MTDATSSQLTEASLVSLRSEALSDLRARNESREGLSLTGIEPFLLALAGKIVVSVVSGFLGRYVYDKYKSFKGRSAEETMRRLAAEAADPADRVPVSVIQEEVVAYAIGEGLPREDAEPVVAAVISRVEIRYSWGTAS